MAQNPQARSREKIGSIGRVGGRAGSGFVIRPIGGSGIGIGIDKQTQRSRESTSLISPTRIFTSNGVRI